MTTLDGKVALITDAAAWTSGQTMYVDGGITVNEIPPGFDIFQSRFASR